MEQYFFQAEYIKKTIDDYPYTLPEFGGMYTDFKSKLADPAFLPLFSPRLVIDSFRDEERPQLTLPQNFHFKTRYDQHGNELPLNIKDVGDAMIATTSMRWIFYGVGNIIPGSAEGPEDQARGLLKDIFYPEPNSVFDRGQRITAPFRWIPWRIHTQGGMRFEFLRNGGNGGDE